MRRLAECSGSVNAEKAKGLQLFRRQQIQTKDAAKLTVTAYATKVSSSSFVARMGCSCNAGGAGGAEQECSCSPSRGESPRGTSWGWLRKEEGGMGAGPGIRGDTAADGKQIFQLRDSEHQATHQGARCELPSE